MNILTTIKDNKATVILMALVGIVVAIGVTLVQPFEYRSTFSVLVIEKGNTQDAFSAAKSAERLSLSLGQIIYTTSFYDKVMRSSYLPNTIVFPSDDQKRREEWKRMIDIRVMPDIGQMKISVYDRNPDNATAIANTIAMVLTEQGNEYLGGSEGVTLKVVDYPLTSKRPARPNIPLNIIAGLLLGGGATVGYLTARSARNESIPKRVPEIPYTSNEIEDRRVNQPVHRQPPTRVERTPVAIGQPRQYMFQNQYRQELASTRPDQSINDDSTTIHTLHDQLRSSQSDPAAADQAEPKLPEEVFRSFE